MRHSEQGRAGEGEGEPISNSSFEQFCYPIIYIYVITIFIFLLTQQQKTALMRNNSALQSVTLRTKSELSETHLNSPKIPSFFINLYICRALSPSPHPSIPNACYFPLTNFSSILHYQTTPSYSWLYSSYSNYISFLFYFLCQLFSKNVFHSSRSARASKFSHLPFRQLSTVPAGIPTWALQSYPVQECVHQQHYRVSSQFHWPAATILYCNFYYTSI